jgi:hypothetical protein
MIVSQDSFLCLEYQIHNKLQPRILKKGEVKPPDYDMFVQCCECGMYSLSMNHPMNPK